MAKNLSNKKDEMERKVSRSYSVIKNDLLKLKRDLKVAYISARDEARKRVEAKLNKSKKIRGENA